MGTKKIFKGKTISLSSKHKQAIGLRIEEITYWSPKLESETVRRYVYVQWDQPEFEPMDILNGFPMVYFDQLMKLLSEVKELCQNAH